MGKEGDRSLEFETTGSFGKQQGLYRSIEQEFIFEPTLTDLLDLSSERMCSARTSSACRACPISPASISWAARLNSATL